MERKKTLQGDEEINECFQKKKNLTKEVKDIKNQIMGLGRREIKSSADWIKNIEQKYRRTNMEEQRC